MPPCRHARADGLLHARGSLPPQGWCPQGLEECPQDRAVRDDPRLDHDAGGTFLSRQFGHQSSDDAQGNPQDPANAGAAYFAPDQEGDGRRGDCRNAHRKNEWSRERTPSPRHVAHWSAANEEGGRKRCHHEPEREPRPVHRASGECLDRCSGSDPPGFGEHRPA